MPTNPFCRRILVVDDMESIHADFKKALAPPPKNTLADIEGDLFGEAAPTTVELEPTFELAFASQGLDAVAMLHQAKDEGRPFAMAFVDVRMPPGLDGIETIVRLWDVDPRLEVAICTAYSDYSWRQMLEKLKKSGQFLVLGKPFDGTVVRQMALGLTEKWNLARAADQSHADLEEQVEARTRQLSDANNERARLERRLQHAQKLEALGRLVAGVAHEINNPLAFVLANLEHLKLELEEMSEKAGAQIDDLLEVAEEAQQGGKRIQAIVSGLKSFSLTETRQLEDVDLKLTMEFALKMAKQSFPPSVQVNLAVADGIPPVRAASGPLTQVFMNLASNAAHAVSTLPAERQKVDIEIACRAGQQISVMVRDSGVGISDADQSKLFEPFFTTRQTRGGTGLGLSICHGIVSQLGGEIHVASRLGEGTTFTVVLPVACDAQVAA